MINVTFRPGNLFKWSCNIPAHTRRWTNGDLMLAHRLRLWTNIKSTLFQRIVLAGMLKSVHDWERVWNLVSFRCSMNMVRVYTGGGGLSHAYTQAGTNIILIMSAFTILRVAEVGSTLQPTPLLLLVTRVQRVPIVNLLWRSLYCRASF